MAISHNRDPGARRRPASPQWYVGAVALAWVALHTSGLLDRLGLQGLTFVLLTLMGAVGTLIGVRRWRPVPPWPWLAIFGALLVFAVGGALRDAYDTLGNLHSDRSPVPDLVTLPGYAIFACGVYGIVRARTREQPRNHQLNILIDAALASLAALAVAWTFLMANVLVSDASTMTRMLVAAFPPMSVFVVALGARLTLNQGRRSPLALRLIVAALGLMLVGDVVYTLVEIAVFPRSPLAELPYAMAYICLTMAVLHPSMRMVTEPTPADAESPPSARLAIVAFALCVPAVVSVFPSRNDQDQWVLAVIVVAMTATAALRMFRALHEHANSEERLAFQATHDQLTGLPNRILIQQRLTHALAGREAAVALLFIDIDRFKLVNDTMGHGTGDELLSAAARRLQATLRPHDIVGRGGGDEFLIVAHNVRGTAHALDIAERTRLSFATPFRVRDAEIAVSASIGVAVQLPSGDPASAETMFRDADTAMYQAKSAGGDAVALFDSSVRVRIAERVKLERELRYALQRQQFEVHFQPVVRADDGHVCGMEALLRWTHPWLGVVRPDRFIPIAEDSGLIVDVGSWVLDQACAEAARLRALFPGSNELYVAVNLSARQLRDDRLVDQVAKVLADHDLPPHALCLELTESLLMENVERTAALLTSLRACGVRISIDDFGTGYSSLAYLKQLPVDEVKIDRSFVTDLGAGGADTSLVSAVVAIASSFGMSTVAEGVEEPDQAERLIELGCQKAQGYLYSRAVPALELPAVIARLGLSDTAILGMARSA